jgi:hypothetical protein
MDGPPGVACMDTRHPRRLLAPEQVLMRFSIIYDRPSISLLVHACSHTNEFLDTLKKLMNFLEYGSPDGRTRVATRDADTDVKAAVLRDVDGLTYRKIGEELDLPRPKDFEVKGDYARVRQMVSRGRKIIFLAIGKDGWRRHIEAMRAEAKRWNSLSDVEQEAEGFVEYLGLPYEEALRIAEEENSRTPRLKAEDQPETR